MIQFSPELLGLLPDHVRDGLPAHHPRLLARGDGKVELEHLLADVATLAEAHQPSHQVRALLNVRRVVGIRPELVHQLQLPLLRVQGHLPLDEEALPLFVRQP